MKRFSYVLTKPYALHARPVSNLMREVSRFQSSVHLTHGTKRIDLTDARALMNEKIESGSQLTVMVEGKDEEAAVAAIQNYFVENM